MGSAYTSLLEIARRQADAVARGELESAVALMDERTVLLASAGTPDVGDVEAIHEIMRLDRDLASAIRERMIQIRNEARDGHAGRQALSGYGRTVPAGRKRLDRLS